jgi:hypothetical protein
VSLLLAEQVGCTGGSIPYACNPDDWFEGGFGKFDAGVPICSFGQTVCHAQYQRNGSPTATCAPSDCRDCTCLCPTIPGNCKWVSDGCVVLDGGFLFVFDGPGA